MESLLPAISKLIALMLSWASIRSTRRRYLFEKVFDPVFDELLEIHRNYIALFDEAINKLPFFMDGEGWRDQDNSPIDPNSAVFTEAIENAKRVVTRGRAEYEALREKIRQTADSFFGAKLKQEEKRFLFAVICYFIRPELRINSDNSMIDMEIKLLEEQGSHEALDTPLTSVAGNILPKKNSVEIRNDLAAAKFNQLARWTEVCRLYAELKRSVAMKT